MDNVTKAQLKQWADLQIPPAPPDEGCAMAASFVLIGVGLLMLAGALGLL